MGQLTDRRLWLKQAGLSIGGIALATVGNSSWNGFDPTGPIRLHANENPYGPSPAARKAMAAAIISSNCYPWEVTTSLREKIAGVSGLTKENVLVGAGSSEILDLVAQLSALQKGHAITADPTFGIWFTAAQKGGLEIIKVPLTSSKMYDLMRMRELVNDQTRLVYICNPNNPTGTIVRSSELREFVRSLSSKTLVLLDEAYTEYCEEPTLASWVKDNPNLVIAKTFSKIYGMAGARVGYALAHTDRIKQLNELQPWANAGASAVSLAGALASFGDSSFIEESRDKNHSTREWLCQSFREMGINYIPSSANFVYYSLERQKKDVLDLMTKNNIRAGRLTEKQGKWTRISLGTQQQMQTFVNVLKRAF